MLSLSTTIPPYPSLYPKRGWERGTWEGRETKIHRERVIEEKIKGGREEW